MNGVILEKDRWLVRGRALGLAVDRNSALITRIEAGPEGQNLWAESPVGLEVRDDLLEKKFDAGSAQIDGRIQDGKLLIEKRFEGAPWILRETYAPEDDRVRWTARLELTAGAFRSCAIGLTLPWPERRESWQVWTARHDMPKALGAADEEWIENQGMGSRAVIPALAVYNRKMNWGLALCKPFEAPTPRLRFGIGRKEPGLRVVFDWLALAPDRPAEVSLLLRGIPGCWRPALGWIFDMYREYFVPRSKLVASLWGGHNCSDYKQTEQEISSGARAGEKWCEIHGHFSNYGQYDSQAEQWASVRYLWRRPKEASAGPPTQAEIASPESGITLGLILKTIRLLNKYGIAPLPYIQVCGNTSGPVTERFKADAIVGLDGKPPYWHQAGACYITQINADPSLAFGRYLEEMIAGMLRRYEGNQGVFVDQACYDFPDTAHFDGISAIANQPAYMQRFNYNPRLEWLSAKLHPDRVIMANGPVTIEIMRAIDGIMAEVVGAADCRINCRQYQCLALVKPMFCLLSPDNDRRRVAEALKTSLVFACGYTAGGNAEHHQDVYDAYVPLINKLARRTWIFDPDPLTLPAGWEGGIFRGEDGNILVPMVIYADEKGECAPRPIEPVTVRTADVRRVREARLWLPGAAVPEPAAWQRSDSDGEITIGPMSTPAVAALFELIV
jgi:hypothetical protein